jgi:hypothetical protein
MRSYCADLCGIKIIAMMFDVAHGSRLKLAPTAVIFKFYCIVAIIPSRKVAFPSFLGFFGGELLTPTFSKVAQKVEQKVHSPVS